MGLLPCTSFAAWRVHRAWTVYEQRNNSLETRLRHWRRVLNNLDPYGNAHTSSNQVWHGSKLLTHVDKEDEEPRNIHTHIDLLGDGRYTFELFD
ncbi:hypothetical protein PIB30_098751 [Stylosanthes scabra]|uniref:Uncharacterized protein n=1 Tax=Stylosanthes scabra TaxID=79078 RepID=A0ABU6ZW12_9FABA|nr:hypothetical protein [Stylosanthes scabra]